jgi:hypothetical protein
MVKGEMELAEFVTFTSAAPLSGDVEGGLRWLK